MLYGKCKKVLKSVNFLCARREDTTTFDIGVYLHNQIQTEDLLGCLHQLKDDGFIDILSENGPLLYIKPTHQGRHFREQQRAVLSDFIFKSILTPIVVAFLTTIITLALEKMLR